jgi:DNA-binding PadR family transcriptional regulator
MCEVGTPYSDNLIIGILKGYRSDRIVDRYELLRILKRRLAHADQSQRALRSLTMGYLYNSFLDLGWVETVKEYEKATIYKLTETGKKEIAEILEKEK